MLAELWWLHVMNNIKLVKWMRCLQNEHAEWAKRKSMTNLSYIKLQYSITQAANQKILNYTGRNAWSTPTGKKCLHVGLLDFSSCCSSLKLQKEIWAVDSLAFAWCTILWLIAKKGLDTHSISIYGSILLPFFEGLLVMTSILYLLLLKMVVSKNDP